MSNPKVSIIVPIYNVEKYLDRCMNSLLNQTLREIEIILVDDGSPDNCPRMCDDYAKKDCRVKVIHKKNAGLGYARNSGLDLATGEYIAFVDSDDYVASNMYEKLYCTALATKSDTVYCGFLRVYDGRVTIHQHVQSLLIFKENEVAKLLLDFIASSPEYRKDWKYEMSVWHAIYSSKIIREYDIKFISERILLSEDLPFQIDYLKEANSIAYLPDCLYYYCTNNENSLTHTNYSSEKLIRALKLIDFLSEETEKIKNADLRIKRCFISYLRALLYGVVGSDLSFSQKRIYTKALSDNKIWRRIAGYPYDTLNLNSKIICYLQRHGYTYLSLVYVYIIIKIKKLWDRYI